VDESVAGGPNGVGAELVGQNEENVRPFALGRETASKGRNDCRAEAGVEEFAAFHFAVKVAWRARSCKGSAAAFGAGQEANTAPTNEAALTILSDATFEAITDQYRRTETPAVGG
jgi:hypothetical protein